MFVVLKSHFWERDGLCDPVECDYLVQFSLKFWAAVTEDTVVGPCWLPYRLTAQRHRNFLKTIQRVLLKMYQWGKIRGFSITELLHATGKIPAVIERDIFRKVECTREVKCVTSSVAGPKSDFLGGGGSSWRVMFSKSPSGLTKISWQDFRQLWHHNQTCSKTIGASQFRLPWNEGRTLRKPTVTTRRTWFHRLIPYTSGSQNVLRGSQEIRD